jgi:hypothetical protein
MGNSGEIEELIDRAARAFVASGVNPGDTIGVWMPNRWEWVVAALAYLAYALVEEVNDQFVYMTPYVVTLTATDGAGLSASVPLRVTVVAGTQGSVSGTVTTPAGTANLTAEGTADWVHVGLLSATSVNRKAGVTPRIGPVTGLDKTPGRFSATKRLAYDWTDGTPTAAALSWRARRNS